MRAQLIPKTWLGLDSIWRVWRPPAYSHLKEQETSNHTSPSAYQDDDIETGTEQLHTHQRPRPLAPRRATIVLTIVVAIQSVMLFAQQPTRLAHNSPVPEFALNITSFEEQPDWEFSPQASDLWAGVIPTSGLIAIKYPERYSLKHGLETSAEASEVYGLQVTHEFHCLKMIRESFFGLVTRDEDYMTDLYAPNSSVRLPQGNLFHVFHCFDYLRQTILCRADTTLEWRSEINPLHIDGYGPPHTCRKWDEVYEWMVENLPPDARYHKHQ